MTRKRNLKIRVLSAFFLFIAVLTVLIAFAAPGQQADQPSAESSAASVPAQASTPAQALLRPLLPGASNAQFVSAGRLQGRKAASAAPDSGSLLFLPAVTYFTGGDRSYSVAVADVNGDGKPDLVVGDCCGRVGFQGVVSVLLGNGNGTFQPAMSFDSGGSQTASVAVADLNGDGKPDLVVANSYYSNTVGVLLGNGDGTFQPVVTYSSGGGGPWSVVVADVNGDGKPDILVANQSSCYGCTDGGLVGVLLNEGKGTFLPAVAYGSGGYSLYYRVSLAVTDLNGDGKLDLVVTNACGGSGGCSEVSSLGVLLGNGDGTFQPAVAYFSGGASAYSVAVADVNGDGKPDLLVTNGCPNSGSCGQCTIGVLLGHGDGTFQPAVLYSSGGDGANSVAAADVNGDGKPDLVVANACGNGNCGIGNPGIVGVLLGNGDGTFQEPVTYGSGGYWIAISIAVADVNGDDRPDLLVVNHLGQSYGPGSVGVLLNNTPFDTTPPVVTLSANPRVLWPPNGKMVPVIISGTITDTGSGVNLTSTAYAVQDEYGKVQPTGAITLGPGGSYSFTVLLQASRLGTDLDGRRYTVTVQANDNAGNGGSKTIAVTVPHDQGN